MDLQLFSITNMCYFIDVNIGELLIIFPQCPRNYGAPGIFTVDAVRLLAAPLKTGTGSQACHLGYGW